MILFHNMKVHNFFFFKKRHYNILKIQILFINLKNPISRNLHLFQIFARCSQPNQLSIVDVFWDHGLDSECSSYSQDLKAFWCKIKIHLWTSVWIRLLENWYIKLSVSISSVFYYHIMRNDTCSHYLSNFYFIPQKGWIFYYGKSSL